MRSRPPRRPGCWGRTTISSSRSSASSSWKRSCARSSPGERSVRDAELLEPPDQAVPADAEQLGGLDLVPAGPPEGGQDELAVELVPPLAEREAGERGGGLVLLLERTAH